jgi:hypothetical protein
LAPPLARDLEAAFVFTNHKRAARTRVALLACSTSQAAADVVTLAEQGTTGASFERALQAPDDRAGERDRRRRRGSCVM